MRFGKLVLPILMLALCGCSYRLATRKGDAVAGRTLAVPTFVNRTSTYRIEQRVSEALRKELGRSTRYVVTPERAGDVVVEGEVLSYAPAARVFTEQGRASQYQIDIVLKVLVTDTQSGMVLYQNDSLVFREIFQLAQSPDDFVPEDPAAWDRLAGKFASFLTAALVHQP